MQTATLRLFSAIQVVDRGQKSTSQDVHERTVPNGYILHPSIQASEKLLATIESIVGISGEKANAAFHKSWAAVRDTPIEILVVQQVLHYITTYGFEALGIFENETVFIPHEALDLPEIKENIPLTVIRAMDAQEILEAIINLGSGVALAQETLDDIMTIVKGNYYDDSLVRKIRNRELSTLLYDFYDLAPEEPEEFLRFLVRKLTGESLLIKNDALIDKIKNSGPAFLDALIKIAPPNLGSIFYRYKPLFLAMKSISGDKTFFNRLRKQANKLHKPLPEDYLNSITAQIKHGELDMGVLEQRLEGASVFRNIRLAYALRVRLNFNTRCRDTHPIVYRIRNGRGWVTETDWPKGLTTTTTQALEIVLGSISRDIRKNVEGKTIYIPPNIHYSLPATEKQFTGHLPTGSFVSVPRDMIVGIHWQNNPHRVDLDLSLLGNDGKIGWDGVYRSHLKEIYYSGDVTNAPAPDGASELFYIKKDQPLAYVLMANYYNFSQGDEVEANILVGHEDPSRFDKSYMIDVSNIIASATINITRRQNILGLVANVNGDNRFYFANVSVGNSITSRIDEQARQSREYLTNSLVGSLELRDVLITAGAVVVDEKPRGEYVDLSPQALDKTTIMDLITKGELHGN